MPPHEPSTGRLALGDGLGAAPYCCSPVLRGLGCSLSGLVLSLHTSLWPTLLSSAPFYGINHRSSPGFSSWEQVSLGHDLHFVSSMPEYFASILLLMISDKTWPLNPPTFTLILPQAEVYKNL